LQQWIGFVVATAFALGLVAVCRLNANRRKEALEPAQQAVALAPDNPFLLTILARAQLGSQMPREALATLEAALEVDPTFPAIYVLLAQIAYNSTNWQGALEHTEKGLEFDPEDEDLINLRAMALTRLNRTKEAAQTVDYALYTNPENSYSHSNKGWVQVEQGQYKEAVSSFKDALRFDPANESAREGLKEAIKAKNWLYRLLLRYFLFMSKLSSGNQWAVVIGLYLGMRMLRSLSKTNGMLEMFITPLLILYMVFAFATWIGKPLSDLALRLHPLGKLALNDDEKRSSNWVGICLLVALLVLGGSYAADGTLAENLTLLAISLFAMMIPIGGLAASSPDTPARKWLERAALAMFLIGPGNIALAVLGWPLPLFSLLLTVFGIAVFTYSWIVNYIISKSH
jgi:tetratricopeptide (TPR) repeat protein